MAKKGKAKLIEDSYGGEFDSDEVDFSDDEDFVDKISDEELLGDILAQKPKESDVSHAVVVIDGLPEVPLEKLDKLRNHIRKLFKDCLGGVVSDSFPCHETKTKGFALLEFKNKSAAEEAVRLRNNYAMDKVHTLKCYPHTEISNYNVADKFEAPQRQAYKDTSNLHYYLLDENCYDQFVVIHNPRNSAGGNKTTIFLNSMPEPTMLTERPCWTEHMVAWSPKGSYLTTFHSRGIALWGREKFDQIQKIAHSAVQFVEYSPNEKYVVSYSPSADCHGEEPKAIIISDVRTGLSKRNFHAEKRNLIWPVFKWSNDDKYFARLGKDQIMVYETPSFGLLDKKSIKIDGVQQFNWSPTDNTIAYWIAENNEVPAKVALMSFPTKEEIRFKNLFNVADCRIYWQKSGDYLCVSVRRYTKVKRDRNEPKYSGIYYSLEIFHMRERGIPVDSIEIKEPVHSINWEPTNQMLGVITGELSLFNIIFYQVAKGQAPVELKRYEKCPYNSMHWSPRGQFVVLAGLSELNGAIEFIDTANFTVMNSSEHFMVTNVEWDPTGRYVATSVSWWHHKVDNAYWLWSFQGKCLRKTPMDEMCQFLWRPRPVSPITAADIREIKKRIKKYGATFELQDQMRSNKASQDIIDMRRSLMETFNKMLEKGEKSLGDELPSRVEMRGRDTDVTTEEETYEEVIEFLIKKETVAAA